MSDIFLSYAREDKIAAKRLTAVLAAHGWSVWWDPHIRTGEDYREVIDKELADARCVIVLWSKRAIESNWVIEEAEDGKKRKILVPVLVEDVQPPRGFRLIQTARLPDLDSAQPSEELERLLRDIAGILGPPSPRPLPARVDRPVDGIEDERARQKEEPTRAREQAAQGPRPAQRDEKGAQKEDGQERPTHKAPVVRRRWAVLLVPILFLGGVVLLVAPRILQGPPPVSEPVPVSEMVKVPGGPFWMGCNEKVDQEWECAPDEKPGHSVNVDAFSIDRTEVTVAQYRQCVRADQCTEPSAGRPTWWPDWAGGFWAWVAGRLLRPCNWDVEGRDNHPVNCVDSFQASAYCQWAGKRLPSEAEWEKAARGTDGRKYPWGNEWSADKANVDAGSTTPVGSFLAGASPYGVLDMGGNVYEWVSDEDRGARALRGGSWTQGPRGARASDHVSYGPLARSDDIGFRCAQ